MKHRGAMMRRAFVASIVVLAVSAVFCGVAAQEQRNVPKIGLLFFGSPDRDVSDRAKPFREGMASLGWIEGRTVRYDFRFASGSSERLAAHAAELAGAPVDVIAAVGTAASRAARDATGTIPIVMLGVGDPVGAGLVANLAQPGGNVTGTSLMLRETQGKNLEILKEAIPGLKRVAIVHTNDRWFAMAGTTAARLEIETQNLLIRNADDLQRRFAALTGAEAIWVLADPFLDEMRGQIADLALRHRLPSMGPFKVYSEAGFLFSYSASSSALHRGAYYVDRILKGARPGDLPIEQPTKFELVINLKTAKALGITIPESVLLRADVVIE